MPVDIKPRLRRQAVRKDMHRGRLRWAAKKRFQECALQLTQWRHERSLGVPVQESISDARFGEKDIQSWDVSVPFHEGGHRTETRHGMGVEPPDLG